MIIELPQSEGNTFGFEIVGTVTLEPQRVWINKIPNTLREHEQINMLIVMNEDACWGFDAGVVDTKWVMRHMSSIKKIAIVSSSKVWNWLVSIDSLFASMVRIQEKDFDPVVLGAA